MKRPMYWSVTYFNDFRKDVEHTILIEARTAMEAEDKARAILHPNDEIRLTLPASSSIRTETAREVGKLMGKLKSICEPKNEQEWRELAASYNEDLSELEEQLGEFLAVLKDMRPLLEAANVELPLENTKAGTVVKRLTDLAKKHNVDWK